MRIAIATALSNSHILFLDHLVKSIKHHSPDFNLDWFIFCNPDDDTTKFNLSVNNRKHALSLYPFKITHVDPEAYAKQGKGFPIYYSLECFNLEGYDRVVYFDSDLLAMQDIKGLLSYVETIDGIGMARELRRDSYNAGTIIVGPKFLNAKTYQDLMGFPHESPQFDNVFGHDQKILNCYFRDRITLIPHKFDVMVTETECMLRSDIVFLHYFLKPNMDVSRNRLEEWQKREWDQYDDPQGRYNGID